jgi:DNA adenine methylase
MLTSPLRYPGGKAKLFPFFAELIRENKLSDSTYCEPYAGGAGLALRLLEDGFVQSIRINDIDPSIYAFWISVLQQPDDFCNLIERTAVDITEWHKQHEIWRSCDITHPLRLGFATYFLNRTNRSGIIDGAGPVGGYAQSGRWKLDARFIKDRQIFNIRRLSRWRSKIEVSNLDAIEFFHNVSALKAALIYLDPPYFEKGRKLYTNFYEPKDHKKIANELLRQRNVRWILSYDDVWQIREIYSSLDPIVYSLQYSAGKAGNGCEVMFASDALKIPTMPNLYPSTTLKSAA